MKDIMESILGAIAAMALLVFMSGYTIYLFTGVWNVSVPRNDG